MIQLIRESQLQTFKKNLTIHLCTKFQSSKNFVALGKYFISIDGNTLICVLQKTSTEFDFSRKAGFDVWQFVKEHFTTRESVCFLARDVSKQSIIEFIEGCMLSSYTFGRYKSKQNDKQKSFYATDTILTKDEIKYLNTMVETSFWCRDLVNEPHINQSALQFADSISKKAKLSGVSVKILNKTQIEKERMGGLLGVNKGSVNPPTFIVLDYNAHKKEAPIVLVGKGLVFDTGGLNLKPDNYMSDMKHDMAGGALMASVVVALAAMNFDKRVIALIPATDNRPGMNAVVPGDVLTMRSGTTVEIDNTDAEGRLILADALDFAKQYKPKIVIDAATLTGAASRAVGKYAMVAMHSKAEKYMKTLTNAMQTSSEKFVELPLWDEYYDDIKSTIADLKNSGGAYAGAITAGKFLEHFTDYPYIHLDIAGVAFHNKSFKYYGSGGSAFGLRLLVDFLMQM